jgi:hypothetical protein
MAENLELPEDDIPPPIRVAETVISTYQWDIWRESVGRASRKALAAAVVAAVVVAAGLGAMAYGRLDGAIRASVFFYVLVLAGCTWLWLRRTLTKRWMTPVLDELRPFVVPSLVSRIDDLELVGLAERGGALVVEESTVISSDRRGAAVVLVASKYDMSLYPNEFFGGDSGSAGG